MPHLRQVLTLLSESGVTLELNRLLFLAENIDFLWNVIRPGRLKNFKTPTFDNKKLKYPINQTELRFFLGFCNVLSRYVPKFSRVSATLNKKLRND